MTIREKCGILAFIPERNKFLKYDYLIDASNDKLIKSLELNSEYDNFKINKSEIVIASSFANSMKKLNHRGYDGYGYTLLSRSKFITKVFHGKVSTKDIFLSIIHNMDQDDIIIYLVGHLRYSTNDSYSLLDNQPYESLINNRKISICFNGNIELDNRKFSNLYNAECRYMLSQARSYDLDLVDLSTRIKDNIGGAFSSLICDGKSLCAFRDNHGIRPLVSMKSENLYIISSENSIVANEKFKENFLNSNDIHIFTFNDNKACKYGSFKKEIVKYRGSTSEKLCSFEAIYFSSSKSYIPKGKIENLRIELGELLAEKESLDIDNTFLLSYIPSTAESCAYGYSNKLKINLSHFIKKSSQYERSFIKKNGEIKETLSKKFSIDYSNIRGKKIILLDDSMVRGHTVKFISEKLKFNGASEVHVRIASPIIKSACKLGVNTKDEELICKAKGEKELCEELNIDSILFIEKKELTSILGKDSCLKCFIR